MFGGRLRGQAVIRKNYPGNAERQLLEATSGPAGQASLREECRYGGHETADRGRSA